MRIGILILLLGFAFSQASSAAISHQPTPPRGSASWYGEAHRGRLMANGRKFDPNKLTAASWFYPLGSKVRVIHRAPGQKARTVLVTITDRGPALDLVQEGRIIDLTHAAFKRLGNPDRGLMPVTVQRIQ